MAANYDDVMGQLVSAGLLVSSLETGRMVRCRVEGSREKKGWYVLHEVTMSGGDRMLVGSFGVWSGSDNGAQKIAFDRKELSKEQLEAITKRQREDAKRAKFERERRAEMAAKRAESVWRKLKNEGDNDYLTRKGITAYGLRYTDKGALAIPMLNGNDRVVGLQFILNKNNPENAARIKKIGRDKEYWPSGLAKKGSYFLIGSSSDLLIVVEGYATGASIHAATGLPVLVAFDANNIEPAVETIRKRNPKTKILLAGDDDRYGYCGSCQEPVDLTEHPSTCPACGKPHKKQNAGHLAAELLVMKPYCHAIFPQFNDETARFQHFKSRKGKLSDFNDLHLVDGLHTVRNQIETCLTTLGWTATPIRAGADQTGGRGASSAEHIRPIDTVDELIDRFSLIYAHGSTAFDHDEHCLVKLPDLRDACLDRSYVRRWLESPLRKIVRIDAVGFDPAENDPDIICNLWDGWPTQPKEGNCERLLELLEYMCNGEAKNELFNWVLKWLAYPIQHPGAKMKTTLVIHGPQGTGKNLFFECVMKIYGKYGRILNQDAVEDKFNDWASKKLFLIADEVVARSDLYHVKNKLKAFITGDWIRINPKNMMAYEERNHVNLVFLSNERMPVVLEEDDRRHAVIWTPEKLSATFYQDVATELQHGGIEALHDYLLNLDLTDFDEHSKPPMTKAKADLIELSKDSILRFWDEWRDGDIDGIKILPAETGDVYELYRHWCGKQGIKPAPLNRAIDGLAKVRGAEKSRKRIMVQTQTKQRMLLIPPGGPEMPPGQSEMAWLGQCVSTFKNQIDDWKANT